MKTERGISHVVVSFVGREDQFTFTGEDEIRDAEGRQIGLEGIAEALSRPGGWIEYETEIRKRAEEEWRAAHEWKSAVHRIYARGVSDVATARHGG